MTDITDDAAPIAAQRPYAGRFDQVSIALHWLTVLLIVGQFTTGWMAAEGTIGDPELAFLIHRSLGVVTWGVVALRLVWRYAFAALPPFPESMGPIQQWAAKLNEYALYLLLVAQPMTGLASLMYRGRPIVLFTWTMPTLVAKDREFGRTLFEVHEKTAWALLALIGIHAVAGLLHAFVFRDGVMGRMLPWTRKSAET